MLREPSEAARRGTSWGRPTSNADIAAALTLSVDAVKGHLRALFTKFALDDLAQKEKRLRLAERALLSGTITAAEIEADRPRQQQLRQRQAQVEGVAELAGGPTGQPTRASPGEGGLRAAFAASSRLGRLRADDLARP